MSRQTIRRKLANVALIIVVALVGGIPLGLFLYDLTKP